MNFSKEQKDYIIQALEHCEVLTGGRSSGKTLELIKQQDKEIERLNNIINELEKSKEKEINRYELLILKIEKYVNCYQYFLETQEENNKKIANMIHEFSLRDSDKE